MLEHEVDGLVGGDGGWVAAEETGEDELCAGEVVCFEVPLGGVEGLLCGGFVDPCVEALGDSGADGFAGILPGVLFDEEFGVEES